MNRKKIFDLKDLNDCFWEKVVYFGICYSTGLGGYGNVIMVTEDKKKYDLGFEDLPFSEYRLAENLHPMFAYTDRRENGYTVYEVEEKGWHRVKDVWELEEDFIRDDIYEKFLEIRKNMPWRDSCLEDLVGLALGTENLECFEYIRSRIAREKEAKLIKEMNAEHERNKLLPEHLIWRPMHVNNIRENPICGEASVILSRIHDGLIAQKFSILFQYEMERPMWIKANAEIESYNLFEKYYDDFYGPEIHPEEWGENREFEDCYFRWICFTDEDLEDYGKFIRSFKTMEEAKEYALCYANANSHRIGNRNTIVRKLSLKEEHKIRIERYEAYQLYRKHYKEILEVITNSDKHPNGSEGAGGLIKTILREVPELSKKQLMYFWEDIPLVLEKHTQDLIEKEREKSMEVLKRENLREGEGEEKNGEICE